MNENAEAKAVRAQQQYIKMTETPVAKLVTMLGIPTIISMLVTSIYNMADTYFVSSLGTSASGAIGIVFGLQAILQAFGFMFGQGSGSIISRRLGARDTEGAVKIASQHPKGQHLTARQKMIEWFLLDRVHLGTRNVSEWHV